MSESTVLSPRNPDDYLLPSERRVIRVRRHWAVLLRKLVETVVLVILAVAVFTVLDGGADPLWLVQTAVWYAAILVVLRFAFHALEWWVERIVITDKRFTETAGILVTEVKMMPTSKVTDMTYRRSVLGRILGYGTLVIESAGQDQALNRITYLPRPEEVYDAISELVFGEEHEQGASAGRARGED